MGTIAVPAAHYWGAQTQRSITNFPFGQRMPLAIVHAFGQLKAACAEANRDLGKLDPSLCAAIVTASDEVAAGSSVRSSSSTAAMCIAAGKVSLLD